MSKKPQYGTYGAQKPLKGHKCLGAKMCFEVSCECGWISCPHSGEGARGYAYAEWREHVASGHARAAQAARDEGQV